MAMPECPVETGASSGANGDDPESADAPGRQIRRVLSTESALSGGHGLADQSFGLSCLRVCKSFDTLSDRSAGNAMHRTGRAPFGTLCSPGSRCVGRLSGRSGQISVPLREPCNLFSVFCFVSRRSANVLFEATTEGAADRRTSTPRSRAPPRDGRSKSCAFRIIAAA
jgi:hypothetical protein